MKSAVKEVFDTRKNLKTRRWFKPALPCNIYRQLLFYSLGVNKTIFRDRKNARVAPKTQWKGKTWVSGLPNWAKGEEIQASQRQTTEKSSILSEGGTPLQKPLCAAPWGRLLSFLVWKGVNTLPILVWNRVWFSRELRSVWTYLSFRFQMSKKEREFAFFVCSNLSNDNIISAQNPGLKTGMDFRGLVWKRAWKITFFGLK